MLLPALKSEALSKMIPGNRGDYSRVYKSLCECAQAMLNKYRQKQLEQQGHSDKLGIKTRAVEVLVNELGKVQEDYRITSETLSSALKCHVEMLQGHEHLLSEKGNTFELIKQTQKLREGDDQAPASLLRYHELKNKFLGPDSFLNARQKEAMSELAEKQGLTLRILETMEVRDFVAAFTLESLHEAGLLEPDLCARVFERKDLDYVASTLLSLSQAGIFKAGIPGLCDAVIKHEEFIYAGMALEVLKRANLLEPDLCAGVLKHKKPGEAAHGLRRLNEAGLLKDWYDEVLKHENPDITAQALVKLNKYNLATVDNCSAALKRRLPIYAVLVIRSLHLCHALTAENRDQVLAQEDADCIDSAFHYLGKYIDSAFHYLDKTMRIPYTLCLIINHPDLAKLASEIRDLKENEKLDWGNFQRCLVKTGFVATA